MKYLYMLSLLLMFSCGQTDSKKAYTSSIPLVPVVTPDTGNVIVYESGLDSATIKRCMKSVTKTKDEFSNMIWFRPRSAPRYTNYPGLYVYFGLDGDRPVPLRFRFHYVADDWLFIESLTFNIDGEIFEYTPTFLKRDNSGGEIFEWFDEPVDVDSKAIITALLKAKSAKIKIFGKQYFAYRNVTEPQINAIKNMVALYKAYGQSR